MGPAAVGSGQRYRPAELLSEDRLGALWTGTDDWSGSPVVVRVLDERLTSDPARLHRAAIQIRAAQLRVSSPHVARILDLDLRRQRRQAAYVVFEGPARETLARRLKGGAGVEADLALRLVAGIADGLAAAHAVWIFHSALSPASVLVDGDAVRVIDLGLGELVEDRDDGGRNGSATNLRDRGPADVLAVGLLFEQLLLGQTEPPAPREIEARRPWEARVPRDVAICLRRALSPHRSQRPDMAELAGTLAPALAAVPAPEPDSAVRPEPAGAEPVAPGPAGPILPPPPPPGRTVELRPAATGRPPTAVSRPRSAPLPRRVRVLGAIAAFIVLLCGAAVAGYLAFRGPDAAVEDRVEQAPSATATPSTGPLERATVPSVLGRRVERAIRQIERAGLVGGSVTTVPGKAGIVLRTDPTPGEAVAGGTVVDLFVGNGAET